MMSNAPVSSMVAEPSSARMQPAKQRKWSTLNGRSAPLVSRIGSPLSSGSTRAGWSRFASMRSAMASGVPERSATELRDQASKAVRAAETAASTSCRVASAMVARRSVMAGSWDSSVAPSEAGRHCPSMYNP